MNVGTIRFGPFDGDPERYSFRITELSTHLIYLTDIHFLLKNMLTTKFTDGMTMDTFLCFLCIGMFEVTVLKNFPPLVYILVNMYV